MEAKYFLLLSVLLHFISIGAIQRSEPNRYPDPQCPLFQKCVQGPFKVPLCPLRHPVSRLKVQPHWSQSVRFRAFARRIGGTIAVRPRGWGNRWYMRQYPPHYHQGFLRGICTLKQVEWETCSDNWDEPSLQINMNFKKVAIMKRDNRKFKRKVTQSNPANPTANTNIDTNTFDIDEKTIKDQQNKK